jgi:hypothetical protein
VERIGAGATVDNVVAGEAENRVIAALGEDEVVAEGDAIQKIDGFGAVRSRNIGHLSFLCSSGAKFHNRSITGASVCSMGGAAKSTSSPTCM